MGRLAGVGSYWRGVFADRAVFVHDNGLVYVCRGAGWARAGVEAEGGRVGGSVEMGAAMNRVTENLLTGLVLVALCWALTYLVLAFLG